MAFLRLPAAMLLLASFILLLYATTSSADQSHDLLLAKRSHGLALAKRSHDVALAKRSHDLALAIRSNDIPLANRSHDVALAKRSHDVALAQRSHDLALAVPAKRVRRDITQKVSQSLDGVKELVSLTTGAESDSNKLARVFEGLASFGKLLPGFSGLAFSIINLGLAFVTQQDPLQKGFEELSRKLDSLSLQVSDLSVDGEWFNYASVYAQDEVKILNAWKKYNEFRKNIGSEPSVEGKLRLAKIFSAYYTLTGTEGSMDNLYHYLTVSETSLSGNLNDLLTRKFKCSVRKISQYNKYFSSLLLKGMVLNQLYWKLIGLHRPDKDLEHKHMLENVYSQQKAVLRNCLDESEQHMKDDVREIATPMDPYDQKAIAEKVKTFLDREYFWYDWVVVVYASGQKANHVFYDMTTVDVGWISVTVGYTQTGKEVNNWQVGPGVDMYTRVVRTVHKKDGSIKCAFNKLLLESHVNSFLKVMHSSYNEYYARAPDAVVSIVCKIDGYWYKMSLNLSQRGPACNCENSGKCVQLLKSKEHVCECPDSFYGDRCQKKINNIDVPNIDRRLVHTPCFNPE